MYLTDKGTPIDADKPKSVLLEKSRKNREKPVDAFKTELSLESLFSKLALVSLFLFIVSLGLLDATSLTTASLIGFLMFSIFSGFLKIRK